jgi:endonuclease YncB( thermonuclease family)
LSKTVEKTILPNIAPCPIPPVTLLSMKAHGLRVLVGLIVILCLACSSLATPVSAASIIEGTVVKIADGDTITVLDPNKVQHRVRLAGIDAPEKGMPFQIP